MSSSVFVGKKGRSGRKPSIPSYKLEELMRTATDVLIGYLKSNAPFEKKAPIALELVKKRIPQAVEDVEAIAGASPKVLVVIQEKGGRAEQKVIDTESSPARVSVQAPALPG